MNSKLRKNLGGDMTENSFFSRILGRDAEEDESGIDWAEAFGTRKPSKRSEPEVAGQLGNHVVKLAVETIDDLPSNFPRESAVRIVRRTLAAAGIDLRYFNRSTWERMPRISSEMELARSRIKELREKTEEDIRFLEGKIRKARGAYKAVLAEEEEEISRVSKELENIKRIRAFFGFSEIEEENTAHSSEERQTGGALYTSGAKQRRAFFSPSDMEGEESTGQIGEKAQVRDSLEAAWEQIEAARAQMRERFDRHAGADRPTTDLSKAP
jgi:hypothetical protein